MTKTRFFTTFLTSAAAAITGAALIGSGALAQLPQDGGIGFQPAATPLAEEVHQFHTVVLLPVITIISLFVLALLIWVILRYNKKANPVPKKFSHNTFIEVVWTVVPVFILLYIALFSFDLLYKEDVVPDGQRVVYVSDGGAAEYLFENDFQPNRMISRREHLDVYLGALDGSRSRLDRDDYEIAGLGEPEMVVSLNEVPAAGTEIEIVGGRSRTGREPFLGLFGEDRSEIAVRPAFTIKATGYQWGWNYSYPDYGDFEFDALLEQKDNLEDPSLYLAAATNNVVVPEGETVRIITTARDVIHSWAIPAFALKIDAVPGRLNEVWFKAPEAAGMYYGFCSEICGKDHAYMPIALEVLPRGEFESWVDEQRALAGLDPQFDNADAPRFADAASAERTAQQDQR